MTNIIPSPAVSLVNGRPAATSLQVAEHFGKRHDHIVRDIRRIISECPGDFTAPNFGVSEYIDETGRSLPMFILHRDGFMLLVMGYTGKKALQIKLAYIAAFNAMEAELSRRAEPLMLPSPDGPITPDQQKTLQDIVKAKVEAIPERERHGGLYPQIWTRFKNHFHIPRYTELPQSRMSEAVAYLMHMDIRPKALPAPEPTPAQRMAMDGVTKLRRIALDYSMTSDSLFGMFIKDDVVQSLHLATVLSMQALASHYAGMAART